jgi:serine/threonine-protein kinase
MAPEQSRHETVDRRADVFSLGVVLYELLTDQKPFRGNTLDEITTAVREHEPPQANKIDPNIPEALALIAARAMEKTPEHRYRSARAFSRELRHWLDENPVSSDGDTENATASKQRWIWGGVAAAGLMLIGAALLSFTTSHRHDAQAQVAAAAETPAPAAAGAVEAVSPAVAPVVVATAASSAAAPSTVDTLAAPPAAGVPAAAQVVALAAAPAAASGARALDPKTAKPAAAKETAKERRAREAREREAKQAAPAPTGVLRFAVSPWGQIEVDGKPAGTSPPLTELNLPEGSHQIVIRNSDLPPYSASVSVTAGQTATLKYKF